MGREEEWADRLRTEFLRLLTVDSETKDMRRREFNQAIFLPLEDKMFSGAAVFVRTDLQMVLEKFDKAVKNVGRKCPRCHGTGAAPGDIDGRDCGICSGVGHV